MQALTAAVTEIHTAVWSNPAGVVPIPVAQRLPVLGQEDDGVECALVLFAPGREPNGGSSWQVCPSTWVNNWARTGEFTAWIPLPEADATWAAAVAAHLIPVADRLPEVGQERDGVDSVLVLFSAERESQGAGRWQVCNTVWVRRWAQSGMFTHWMPLPASDC